MKSLLLLFAVSFAILFINCSNETSELLKTTYQRSFNKEIISKYLLSENPEEVKAALLSVSHSEDTLFIPSSKIFALPLIPSYGMAVLLLDP